MIPEICCSARVRLVELIKPVIREVPSLSSRSEQAVTLNSHSGHFEQLAQKPERDKKKKKTKPRLTENLPRNLRMTQRDILPSHKPRSRPAIPKTDFPIGEIIVHTPKSRAPLLDIVIRIYRLAE